VDGFHREHQSLNTVHATGVTSLNPIWPLDHPSTLILAAWGQDRLKEARRDNVITAFKGTLDEGLVAHTLLLARWRNCRKLFLQNRSQGTNIQGSEAQIPAGFFCRIKFDFGPSLVPIFGFCGGTVWGKILTFSGFFIDYQWLRTSFGGSPVHHFSFLSIPGQ
jgi:hypothetical protein